MLNLPKSHSFFLFGARGVGKTHLLEQHFDPASTVYINLLDPDVYDELNTYPERLQAKLDPVKGKVAWVIIDEVQKAPKLLDVVHKNISKGNFNFALTGSSARKLRRGSANMLAGRAFLFTLFPLTHQELADRFNIDLVLSYGSLPGLINLKDTPDRLRFLKAYSQTYIKEEIVAEQIIRNLPPFRKFIELAASANTDVLSYSNIAKDILSDPKTVSGYYDILEDTLLGFRLNSFHTSIRKRQRAAPKFYFFDTGVARTLAGKIDLPLIEQTFEYGQMYEAFVINEIHRLLTYAERQFQLSYLRVDNDLEIDLVIERAGMPTYLIEVKSAKRVDERSVRALEHFGPDFPDAKRLLLSRDPETKQFGKSKAIEWTKGIEEILAGA
jgi:predicted AAA+ superfamily ATPase